MPVKFTRLEIPEVVLIEPQVFTDERGFFIEIYKQSEFHSQVSRNRSSMKTIPARPGVSSVGFTCRE
jgi:dTDP-4-dehydrorhamnose 3,5-epimerase-like enzyme